MKTFQIRVELVDAFDYYATAKPLAVEYTQCLADDETPEFRPVLQILTMQQLQAKAKQAGKTISAGDAVRVMIYDLKEKRPLLKPQITTWIVCGCSSAACCLKPATITAAQLRPSLN